MYIYICVCVCLLDGKWNAFLKQCEIGLKTSIRWYKLRRKVSLGYWPWEKPIWNRRRKRQVVLGGGGVVAYQDGTIFLTKNVATTSCRTSKPRPHFRRLFPSWCCRIKVRSATNLQYLIRVIISVWNFYTGVSNILSRFLFPHRNTPMTRMCQYVSYRVLPGNCWCRHQCDLKRDANFTTICSCLVSKKKQTNSMNQSQSLRPWIWEFQLQILAPRDPVLWYLLWYFFFCEFAKLQIKIVSWVKRDQLVATCFIITLFSAQHVSDVNTSILRSLRLIRWVTSWVVSGSMCVGVTLHCGYGGVVSVCRLKPTYGYHTTIATLSCLVYL